MNNDKMIAHVTAQLNLAAQLQAEGRKPQMIAVLLQDALFAQERLELRFRVDHPLPALVHRSYASLADGMARGGHS